MNDDLLKEAGGGNYFDELLARIRDIRHGWFFFKLFFFVDIENMLVDGRTRFLKQLGDLVNI
jgi:hypothetical protein